MVTTLLPILGDLVYNILILLFYNNLETRAWSRVFLFYKDFMVKIATFSRKNINRLGDHKGSPLHGRSIFLFHFESHRNLLANYMYDDK